jgi:hypothetical protein
MGATTQTYSITGDGVPIFAAPTDTTIFVRRSASVGIPGMPLTLPSGPVDQQTLTITSLEGQRNCDVLVTAASESTMISALGIVANSIQLLWPDGFESFRGLGYLASVIFTYSVASDTWVGNF